MVEASESGTILFGFRSAAATRSIAATSPLVPRVMRARHSGHASLPINMKPAKLAKRPATNEQAAKVVSTLLV